MGEAGGERDAVTKGGGMKREGGRQRFGRMVDSVEGITIGKDIIQSVC